MTQEILLEWTRTTRAHHKWGATFCWVAESRYFPPEEWRIYRSPSNRYEIWLFGPGDSYRDMGVKEPTPLRVKTGGRFLLGSAPKAKARCQQCERIMVKMWKYRRVRTRSRRADNSPPTTSPVPPTCSGKGTASPMSSTS